MKRLPYVLLVFAGCSWAPQAGIDSDADEMRFSMFRFDDEIAVGGATKIACRPSAWIVYSRSWEAKRERTESEGFLRAYSRRGLRYIKGDLVPEADSLCLAAGSADDDTMKMVLKKMIRAGILDLPSLPRDPDPAFYRAVQGKDEARFTRIIRIQTRNDSRSFMLLPLTREPDEKNRRRMIQAFVDAEKSLLPLLMASTMVFSVGKELPK